MNLFNLALKNLLRRPLRTLITIGAMTFAGSIMIFNAALMEGMFYTIKKNAISMNTGNLQIHEKKYLDDPDLYKKITDVDKVIEKLKSKNLKASPRLFTVSLASSKNTSTGIIVRGIDPLLEKETITLYEHIHEGSWFNDGDSKQVLIGRKLAKTLEVGLGDEIVILSQASDGSMANDIFYVKGIFKSVTEMIDRAGFFITNRDFRELFVIEENSAHEIAITFNEDELGLINIHKQLEIEFPEYEIKNWRQLQPIVARLLDTAKYSMNFILLFIYGAVVIVVMNAMLMTVFERIQEVGVMKAIGAKPFLIFRILFYEVIVQVMIAIVFSSIIGVSLCLYFEEGIDIRNILTGLEGATAAGIAFDPIWYPMLNFNTYFTPMKYLFLTGIVSVIYPALKASFLNPLKAIHYK